MLSLVRAGEEKYASTILEARSDEGSLVLTVDRLLPQPEKSFWREPVAFWGKLVYIDAGLEVITEFRCSVGERHQEGEHESVDLVDFDKLEITSEEYVAALGDAYDICLKLLWFGEWREVKPQYVTVSRLFFNATFDEPIGEDGYAVPHAKLLLEPDGPEIPLRIHLFTSNRTKYEAKIEKIDGVARQGLVTIIEEIWRIAAGLSQRRIQRDEAVGIRSKEFDPFADAFKPRIVYLGNDEEWSKRLETFGITTTQSSMHQPSIIESVDTHRCDLVVADGDYWGEDALQVERLLRSTRRLREIPRFWLYQDAPVRWDGQDIVDYGAFDRISKKASAEEIQNRIQWAMGTESIGSGRDAVILTRNRRVRYRIGRGIAAQGLRVTSFQEHHEFEQFLAERLPAWVLFDADSYGAESNLMLGHIFQIIGQNGFDVFAMTRGVNSEQVLAWLKLGVRDIILLDPSLRQAMNRLTKWVHGDVA